jgi:hypothetical protein
MNLRATLAELIGTFTLTFIGAGPARWPAGTGRGSSAWPWPTAWC